MFASALSTVENLSVIDPCNRTGKISIPASFVSVTKGVSDFLKHGGNPPPDVKDLSLCLLFQKGRCNAGSRCNQVHAAPEYVTQVRARALAARSCCAEHGDVHSQMLGESSRQVIVTKDSSTEVFSLTNFGATPALESLLARSRNGKVRVQGSRLCRLHLKGSCKFGRDCKNIHLCPDAKPVHELPEPIRDIAPLRSDPPALGLAFRAVDINARTNDGAGAPSVHLPCDHSANSSAADVDLGATASRDVTPMLVLSIMSEFQSMRREPEADPLDIMDDDSNTSAASAIDFGAFVDDLVRCGDVEPMASPQWIA